MKAPPFHWPEPACKHYPLGPPGGIQVHWSGIGDGTRTCGTLHRASRGVFPQDLKHLAIGNGVSSPVLKHGPRSQTDAQGRRYCCQYFSRTEREMRTHPWCAFFNSTPTGPFRVEFECACLDPKGGELCLNKVKPGETRVEACSGADVQIARMIWVSERKTHRTT